MVRWYDGRVMIHVRRLGVPLIFVTFIVSITPCLAFEVPANDGFYTQTTPVLTPAQEEQLEVILTDLEKQTSNEIAILVVESLNGEPIEEIANDVFRSWGIGKEGKNNGILLLVASADHAMRIEVGYGLEGAVPDLVAKGIIDRDIAPRFREANYEGGFIAAIETLKKHIAGEYTAERYTQEEGDGPMPFLLFLFFIFFNFFGAWMARTKSWWLGGILGGVFGIVLAIAFAWWVAIPILVLLGSLFDYMLSKNPNAHRRGRGGFWGGGLGGGHGGGGGGFGGFGGGSSGGGGASGRW